MAIPSFSSTVVARAAAALYGVQLGNGTMSAALVEANATGGVEKLINSVYNRDFAAVSNADVAAAVVANLGITGAGVANAVAYLTAKINAAGAANEGAAIATEVANFAALTGDATYGAAATSFNNRISAAVSYAQQGGTADRAFGAGSTIALTMGQDFLSGTSGNDTIVARIFDNQNTLQSGDWVDGGAGTDRLEADMGASQQFAVTPETTGVETFSVRGQSRATDKADNNPEGNSSSFESALVQVDAQRMSGVTRFDSTDSRADVVIEDVRTSLRTKDITIGMIGTDAGNVDYAVYFDRLRADGTSTAQLQIELMDTRAATSTDAATAALPLKNSPFNGFSFQVNGKTILLKDPVTSDPADTTTFNGAQTYPQLLAAVQKLLAANIGTYPELSAITASLGDNFTAIDTLSGISAQGQKILLTGSSAASITLKEGNFIADAGVPPSSGLHTVQSVATSSSTDLITSTAVLDNVGRGSNGGDLVIGAMSVGETSTSAGIDRFEITVEATSNLGIIASTNNALKEVTFQNGTVKGNVTVRGADNTLSLTSSTAATDGSAAFGGNNGTNNNQLPGASAQHNGFGFNDVRMIDASAMTGTVGYDALISNASFAKYIQLSDREPLSKDPATDNDSTDGKTTRQVADFDYSGGAGNDTLNVVVNAEIAESQSNIQPGREDFTLVVKGNGGNDAISVRIDDGVTGGTANWYEAQKMNQDLNIARGGAGQIVIQGGDGNDTVRKPGAGDTTIELGSGNDTVYSDNTGADTDYAFEVSTAANAGRAQWVFNTSDQTLPDDATVAARSLDDIESGDNDSYHLYKSTLVISYRDIETQTPVVIGWNTSTLLSSDLHINQAIKAAIMNDPVLSKLLSAVDGPANSLIVRSLSDGVRVDADLSVLINAPTNLSTTEYNTLIDKWEDDLAGDTEDDVDTLISDDIDLVLVDDGDYDARLGNETGTLTDGEDSTGTTTDNIITGGTGNDVIVLSTTDDVEDGDDGDADDEALDTFNASNETVVYDAAFGDDTVVNFEFSANEDYLTDGADVLDFSGLGGTDFIGEIVGDGQELADGEIAIGDNIDDDTDADEDTPDIDDIEALFDDQTADDTDVTAIYIEVQGTIGYVYQITDGEGASDLSVELMGSIDLADTSWFDLVASNFGDFAGAP